VSFENDYLDSERDKYRKECLEKQKRNSKWYSTRKNLDCCTTTPRI